MPHPFKYYGTTIPELSQAAFYEVSQQSKAADPHRGRLLTWSVVLSIVLRAYGPVVLFRSIYATFQWASMHGSGSRLRNTETAHAGTGQPSMRRTIDYHMHLPQRLIVALLECAQLLA